MDKFSDFSEIVQARRSIRGFLSKPVPQEVLVRLFALAQRAPSNCNTQPWVVHVVSGASAERLRIALHEAAESGRAPMPDFPLTWDYRNQYRERQIGAAVALFGAQGIARDDKEGRTSSFLRNFRFFDAPHAVFVFLPDAFGIREAVDCGLFAQTLMLAMTAEGLASCAQGALSHHADIVHSQLGVPEQHRLLFGIAFGYPDDSHPANDARTDRASCEEATIFHQ